MKVRVPLRVVSRPRLVRGRTAGRRPAATICLAVLLGAAPSQGQSAQSSAPASVAIDEVEPTSLGVRWSPTGSVDGRRASLRVWMGDVEPDASCVVPGQPSILGRSEREEGRIAFQPRLSFRPGLVYTACLSAPPATDGELRRLWLERFEMEVGGGEAARETPRIVSVWPPPGSQVPANLLRVYVEFDQPMRAAAVDRALQLLDERGEVIDDALVPIPEGLWDARGRRLTVNLHPGRIKQGVGPREKQGAALRAGTTVQLRVGEELRSQLGVAIVPELFRYPVGPADREPPDPAAWRVGPPAGPQQPLELVLDERLDPAVLRRAVRVAEVKSAEWLPYAVALEVVEEGRRLRVLPIGGAWRPGSYRLEVLGVVEDLAGNRPGRAFDATLDPDGPVGGERRAPEWFSFPFEVHDLPSPD